MLTFFLVVCVVYAEELRVHNPLTFLLVIQTLIQTHVLGFGVRLGYFFLSLGNVILSGVFYFNGSLGLLFFLLFQCIAPIRDLYFS